MRSGIPAHPEALPSEASLKPVTDAARFVADALDAMPRHRHSVIGRRALAGP
jgi:hypothetical protein